ncbi:MAG TPA: DUF4369 domain-containing protein [Lentimicrobium sp.]|jgi:hypothetical protein|nr:DUF4369 domain-containing protein [Lentimicrobium sp.]
MKFRFVILLLLSQATAASGQDIPEFFHISGCIRGLDSSGIYLREFHFDEEFVTDSATIGKDGCFHFRISARKPAGHYRIQFGGRRFLDLIFSHSDISFHTTIKQPIDSISFENSPENEIYYRYLRFRLKSQPRIENLRKQLKDFSPDDPFFNMARNEYLSLIGQEKSFTEALIAGETDRFSAKLIKLDREPPADPLLSLKERLSFQFSHYLDKEIFSDTSILRSNALSARIISYLSFVTGIWHDDPEKGFRLASINLLAAASGSEAMSHAVAGYLAAGFKRLGYESLAGEIGRLPIPCCSCANPGSEDKKNGMKHANLMGRKFPSITAIGSSGTVSLPSRSNTTLLIIPGRDCIAGQALTENVMLMKPHFNKAGTEVYILSDLKGSGRQESEIRAISLRMDEAGRKKVQHFSGSEVPLLLEIDPDGTVRKAAASWIEFAKQQF